jgi:glucose dehydrogenase
VIPGDVLRHGQPWPRLRRRQDLLQQADTTLVALDAKTGKVDWT